MKDNKLDEKLANVINSGKVNFDFEKWQQKYPEALKALGSNIKIRNKKQPLENFNLWKIIIKNPITKLAAFAVIIIVLLVWIHYFGGSIDVSAKVWADTVQRAQKARTCAYTETLHYEGVPDIPDMKAEVICKEQGYKRTSAGNMVSILNASKRKAIVINHSKKEYTEIDFSSQELDKPSKYDFFERMRTLPERADEVLGEKEINGRNTIGYRIIEKGMNITFWLDTESRDLALSELRFIKAPGIYAVISDFRFDIEADDSLFSLEPPEGYTSRNIDVDRTEAGEKDLVEFLKLWAAQVSNGVFPPSLNLTELTKASIEMKKAGTTIKADTEDEKMRYLLKMTRGLTFILQLKPESDWHYSGKDVKLGESEKVIFRYKPEDSPGWRVIYGDLSIKDVNEKDFPK